MDEKTNNDASNIGGMAYNLNAIMDFVFQGKEKEKSQEVREIYDTNATGSLGMVQKTISEIKNEDISVSANIRYDLVKNLMETIRFIETDDVDYEDEEGEDSIENPVALVNMTFGQSIAFNTLLKEGMLTKIELGEELN